MQMYFDSKRAIAMGEYMGASIDEPFRPGFDMIIIALKTILLSSMLHSRILSIHDLLQSVFEGNAETL